MANVVIFGVGQTADIVSYYLEHDTDHEVVGYTVDRDHLNKNVHNGKPIISF